MKFHPGMNNRDKASASAERLSQLLAMTWSPPRIIAREWVLLWKHMTNEFGDGFFEQGQDDWDRERDDESGN